MRAEPSCRVAFRSTSTSPRNSIPTPEYTHYVFGSTSGEMPRIGQKSQGCFLAAGSRFQQTRAALVFVRQFLILPGLPGAFPVLLSGPGFGFQIMKVRRRLRSRSEMPKGRERVVRLAGVDL